MPENPGGDDSQSAQPAPGLGETASASKLRPLAAPVSILGSLTDRFIPPSAQADPDLMRRGRLVARFGFLGLLFGLLYAAFYLYIGHRWGGGIVIICSILFGITPFVMRQSGSISFAGNFLVGIMAIGFSAMCAVEGGLNGHAIAWLASVPLCALLINGVSAARIWALLSLLSGTAFVVIGLSERRLEPTYDPIWHPFVTSAGYLGLIAFMFILGMIFERSRERAMKQLQTALHELKDSNAQLLALNKEKDELMGIAAHDLKNPLTAVIGNAEMLMLARDPSKVPTYAQRIATAGARMLHLIKSLLDANALEQGSFTTKSEQCSLADLVQESIEHNRTAAQTKETQLNLVSTVAIPVRADRSASVQVLDNLISNAIKYSPRRSTITLRMAAQSAYVCVEVQDQGPGICEEDQKKLFQKFVRLSAQPTDGESSTGLGLSIVKRLAEQMGGSIACRSLEGQGATFVFHLPKWEPLRPGATPAKSLLTPSKA